MNAPDTITVGKLVLTRAARRRPAYYSGRIGDLDVWVERQSPGWFALAEDARTLAHGKASTARAAVRAAMANLRIRYDTEATRCVARRDALDAILEAK